MSVEHHRTSTDSKGRHATAAAPERDTERLSADRLSVVGIVFFVVAAAAPLVGMTGAVPAAIVLGNGAAAPGAYLAVGIVLLVFSVGYAAMSVRVSNSGAFFAYVGRGLGIVPGVGSAFVSLLAYLIIQLGVYGFFGAIAAGQLGPRVGIELPWWAWSYAAWVLVLALSLLQVDLGAKVLGLLMLAEVLSLAVVALVVLLQGGGPDGLAPASSFDPRNIFVGGFTGSAGIALAFAFASYIGFEATAIYGEETKDPKRSVPIATYAAVTLIAVLFALTSWAVVSALGTSSIVDEVARISSVDGEPLADPALVLFTVANQYVGGWLGTTMSWLVLTSLFAGILAFQNSAARYVFSLGRAGILPTACDRVNDRGAPVVGALVTSAVVGGVMAVCVVSGLDPVLQMFFWFGTVAVLSIVVVEVLVSIAVVVFFRRPEEEGRVWNTLIAPSIAAVTLSVGAYLVVARFGLLAGTAAEGVDPTTQTFGLSGLGWFLVALPAIAFVIGCVAALARRRPENEEAIADLVG